MTSKKIVRALRELAEETGLDAPQALNYNALCFSQGEARLDRDRAVQDSCIAHLRDRRAEMDDSADVSEGHRNLRQHIATHVRGEVEAFPLQKCVQECYELQRAICSVCTCTQFMWEGAASQDAVAAAGFCGPGKRMLPCRCVLPSMNRRANLAAAAKSDPFMPCYRTAHPHAPFKEGAGCWFAGR